MILNPLFDPISLYFRKLIIPVAYEKQENFAILNKDISQVDLAKKKKITLLVTGNDDNISTYFKTFRDQWLTNKEIFPDYNANDDSDDRLYVMPGYNGVKPEWTQDSLEQYIIDKTKTIEDGLNGQVDRIYGHSMGGLLATFLYMHFQEGSEKRNIESFTLDRTFTHLLPLATRHFNQDLHNSTISKLIAKFLLSFLNADLNNPIGDLGKRTLPWLNTTNMTVIESIADDLVIPIEYQIGPFLENLAKNGNVKAKAIRYFHLTTTDPIPSRGSHSVGLGLKSTTLKEVKY